MLEEYNEQSKLEFRLWLTKLAADKALDKNTVCVVCDSGSKGGVEDFLIGFANEKLGSYWYYDVEFKIFELGNINNVVGMEFQRVILFNHPEIDYDVFSWLKTRLRGHQTGEALFADLDISNGLFCFWQY